MASTTTPPRKTAPRKTTVKAVPAPHVDITDTDDMDVDTPEAGEYTVTFTRIDDDGDEQTEQHTFRAIPKITYKRMLDATSKRTDTADSLRRFERLIRPALVDTDGVPAKWLPARDEDDNTLFVDPAGESRPMSELPDFTAFEAGSSKRRWLALMNDDDDAEIDYDEVIDFYNKLIEAAGKRPTQRSRS